MSKDPISIFLFHRDFRVIDNNALNALSKISSHIVPIFIFTPEQVNPKKNPFYNKTSINFMKECLSNIPNLQVFYGQTEKVLSSLFRNNTIENIAFNLDYTPYAIQRTQNVTEIAQKYGVNVITKEDYTLLNTDKYRDGGFYKVFRPFYESVLSSEIPKPTKEAVHFIKKKLHIASLYELELDIESGINYREEALKILKDKSLAKNYEKTKNFPSIETTHLSKHIKFGTVSMREVFYAYKKDTELLRQVIWHDFYACLMKYLPISDTIGGGNFKHLTIKWSHNKNLFKRWCDGTTGFPIIDAGMRQLNQTGWMHNRARLLVSNFLAVLMGIDWKWGEQYFAQRLIDYDVSSNNLNWQFSAQIGTDRTAFLRVYNPFIQSEKYDPECIYIKRWIPELMDIAVKDIHNWDKKCKDIDYPKPMIDYHQYAKDAKNKYRQK
jgi:deoxyribodipyrimidine photo-lyase